VRVAGKNPPWQFIHEQDLVELIVLLLKNHKSGIFNLAGNGGVPYKEMIKDLRKPSLALPGWLLRGAIDFTWKLRLQSKGSIGTLSMLEYPILIDNTKVLKATGYQMRYTAREAWECFLKAICKK
jgi:UDP-glucose 4-epimerase